MLSQSFRYLSNEVQAQWENAGPVRSVVFLVSILLLAAWLSWRIWRFTIQPMLRPDEPKELPYWISYSLALTCDRARLGSREPFSLTIAGENYYVITSPPDTTKYFADVVSLTWDGFLDEVLVGFGCDPARLDTLWKRKPRSAVNPAGKNPIHLTEDLFKQHLLPGPTFDVLIAKLQAALKELMSWEKLSSAYGLATASQTRRISLYDLCLHTMINASQLALFDQVLFAIDPLMTANLRTFTDELWKCLHPSRLVDASEVKTLLAQYTRAFRIYQRLPKEMRKNEAWVISTLID
ncbi:hypothetical protein VTN96DRAFT_3807 [Rasamsonia emersonii]